MPYVCSFPGGHQLTVNRLADLDHNRALGNIVHARCTETDETRTVVLYDGYIMPASAQSTALAFHDLLRKAASQLYVRQVPRSLPALRDWAQETVASAQTYFRMSGVRLPPELDGLLVFYVQAMEGCLNIETEAWNSGK